MCSSTIPKEAGVEPSVGSCADSDDNVLAETINGLYKIGLNRLYTSSSG